MAKSQEELAANLESKVDSHTTLLKWILAGVGAACLSLAGFAGSTFNNLMARNDKAVTDQISVREKNDEFLREKIVTTLEIQTRILEQIRDDQRKFPAVADNMASRHE